MKRRSLLLTAATAMQAQQQHHTVYIPERHKVEDLGYLQDFMDEFAFVDFITTEGGLHITHIPSVLDRTLGPKGTIFGHIARNNPQSKTFAANPKATIVFRGPHGYISPAWYANPKGAVPTWNFATVHASGIVKPVEEKKQFRAMLSRLIKKFEGGVADASYSFDQLPDSYVNGMMDGIIGFELQIDALEGKFKLGQERSEADRKGVKAGLAKARPERGILEFTESFLARSAGK